MKKIPVTRRHLELMERAIRYTISTLQYERHQALSHGCKGGVYDDEIEEFKQLKKHLFNESVQSGPASDSEAR